MLAEILMTTKRLQSTVDHSLILLKQVQRDFSGEKMGGSHKPKARANEVPEQTGGQPRLPIITETNGNGKNETTEEDDEEEEGDKVIDWMGKEFYVKEQILLITARGCGHT